MMWVVKHETTNLTTYLFIYLFIFHSDKRCYQRLELDVKLKMRDDKTV